jgi:sec-independent protein translocase protein TatB
MNLGFPEMLFLFLLALLLFGPKKLPEIGRQIGRGLAEFKRASNELKGQLENEMRLLDAEDREKKISPPPPENTIASAPAASSAPAESAPTSMSAAVGADRPATASDETPTSHPGPGVEGA